MPNRALELDEPATPRPVDLANEPDFSLHELVVMPSLRQVRRGSATQALEPRVMQVLVLLAGAGGGVVSRQTLIDRCWGGRVVGDNAVNRVMSCLRRLASGLGAGCFAVETIAKVGYRLVRVEAAVPVPAPGPALPVPPVMLAPPAAVPAGATRRQALVRGALSLATLAGAGTALVWWGTGRSQANREVDAMLRRSENARHRGYWNDIREALAWARRAVERAPGRADAWGQLALAHAQFIDGVTEPGEAAQVMADTRAAADRALALAPGQPDALVARLRLLPAHEGWTEREEQLRHLLARHPHHPELSLMLVRLLCDVGRWREALPLSAGLAQREPALPLAPPSKVASLWAMGHLAAADTASARAAAQWPGHGWVWITRFRLLALTGRPEAAADFAREGGALVAILSPVPYDLALVIARALAARGARDLDEVERAVRQARQERRVHSAVAAQFLAALGLRATALDLLESFYRLPAPRAAGDWQPRRRTDVLFTAPMRTLWPEARFQRLVDELGLREHWRTQDAPAPLRARS